MGCGCQGSTPRQGNAGSTQAATETRAGGPGEPSYYWNGPEAPAPAAAPPKPAEKTA